MVFTHLLAVAALSLSTSATVYQGFNYGATQTDGSVKQQSDFQSEFQTAKGLVGASGFTSARLYTMIVSQMSSQSPCVTVTNPLAARWYHQ
jgi:glucan endo-1,3-beta-D-glucosidase